MNKPKLDAAIAYFEDAIRESDEIIVDCTPDLQAELTEQKGHFVVALEAMRAPLPDNKALIRGDRIRAMSDEELAVELIHCGECPNVGDAKELEPCLGCIDGFVHYLKQPTEEE